MNSSRPYLVADAILDVLKAHAITHIFGYPGGAILPFYDALPSHPEITHILARHEQGAGFMAHGWARSTKKIGVCAATSGPGATNTVTAIMDAMMDSIPLLIITGQVPLGMIGKDMFQETDMTGITLNITKHNYLLDDPLKTVQIVTEAIAIATSGRPGPVHIDVPKDIMASPHPSTFEIPLISYADKYQRHISDETRTLDHAVIDEVIHAMTQAKKPILLIGQGVKHASAEKELKSFIAQTKIPTVTTLLAKGVVDSNESAYLGWLGMHGYYHCNRAMHEADFILNIGSRFDDRIVGRYDVFGQNARIVHVDIDEVELGKVVQADIQIHADAKDFLHQLQTKTLPVLDIDAWQAQIQDWKMKYPYEHTTSDFSMRSVLADLQRKIDEDPSRFIVVTDVGQHQMWTSSGLTVLHATQWLTSGGSGTMGFAVPTAIGAAIAHPDKTILCISGDGGFQMNVQELVLIRDMHLDIKNIILNNQFLGMVRQWQELFYGHNYSQVDISAPDYVKLADAYGIRGLRLNALDTLVSVHDEIFATRVPILIDYQVIPEDNVFPMVPGGKHLGETIVS